MGELKPSVDLAYWTGVVQSDGCFSRDHKELKAGYRVVVEVSKNSLPMLLRFKEVSEILFDRGFKISKKKTRGTFYCTVYVSKFLDMFKELDISFSAPPKPPRWVFNRTLFGAYLAGLIDGDGSITIRRLRYPQCSVRITGGKMQSDLKSAIELLLECSVWVSHRSSTSILSGRKIEGSWFDLEFLVSSKTYEFFRTLVLPHMKLDYKKVKIESYISSRWITN